MFYLLNTVLHTNCPFMKSQSAGTLPLILSRLYNLISSMDQRSHLIHINNYKLMLFNAFSQTELFVEQIKQRNILFGNVLSAIGFVLISQESKYVTRVVETSIN